MVFILEISNKISLVLWMDTVEGAFRLFNKQLLCAEAFRKNLIDQR